MSVWYLTRRQPNILKILSQANHIISDIISSGCYTEKTPRCKTASKKSIHNRVSSCRLPKAILTMNRVSMFYLVGLFDLWSGVQTLAISSVGAYVIAAYIQGPYMPWIGFIFLMGHMSVNHIYRQIANAPSVVDITGLY
jgi:hypothetical protein